LSLTSPPKNRIVLLLAWHAVPKKSSAAVVQLPLFFMSHLLGELGNTAAFFWRLASTDWRWRCGAKGG
jgi:hypothetical protein